MNKGFILLTVNLQNEEGIWTAVCLELGTATLGKTPEQAKKRIREAITLHLNGLEELGERKRFFREHGIEIYPTLPEEEPSALKVDVRPASKVERDFLELEYA